MDKKFLPLNNYLQNNAKFATIRAKLQQNKAILEQVKGLLPPPLNEHCLGLVVKGDQLTLYADSSAWASRLRYLSPELIRKLNNTIHINKISVKVIMDNHKMTTRPRDTKGRFLSENNSNLLQRVADHTSDPDLSAALRRLSLHKRNHE